MKWKMSVPEPEILVYYFAKLLGLAPFTIKKDRFYPPTLLGILYTVLLTASCNIVAVLLLVPVIAHLESYRITQIGKISFAVQHCTKVSTATLILIIFLLRYNKVLYIMNKHCAIGEGLKILGIKEDRHKFFKNLLVTIVMTNAVVIATSVMLYAMENEWNISHKITGNLVTGFRCNVVIIFVQMMLFIKKRFTLVNENLYKIFGPSGHGRSFHNSQMLVVCRNPHEETQPGIEGLTDLQCIRKIESLHLKLCDLVHETTHLFAIPILLKCFQSCLELMMHCFWIYFIIRNSGQLCSAVEIVPFVIKIMCILLQTVILIVQLFAIGHSSVKTCEEGNTMKAVLFKVWYKYKPRDLQDEFFMFSLQLIQKPVTVSIFEFFDLGYSCVYKILCAVVAYVIILIQFEASQPNTSS